MKRFCFLFMVILGLNFCSAQEPIYDTVKNNQLSGAIACKNNIALDSLVKWNNLKNDKKGNPIVHNGDILIVGWKVNPEAEKKISKQGKLLNASSSQDENAVLTSEFLKVKLPVDTILRLDPGSNNSYTWESSHPKIVSVENGVITTHEKGRAKITAKSKQRGQSCTWTITVTDDNESQKSSKTKKIIFYIVFIALVLAIVVRKWSNIVSVFSKQMTNAQCDTVVNNGFLEQISKLEGEKNRLLNENNRLQRENVALEKKITALKRQLDEIIEDNIRTGKELDDLKFGANNKSLNGNNKENAPSMSQIQSQNPTVLYADAIVDGNLIRVKEVAGDDSIFELHLNNSNTAKVVICKNAVQRIIANPSFIDGCEKQILPNASNVEIVTPGTAQKAAESGKWVVVEKLKINIK